MRAHTQVHDLKPNDVNVLSFKELDTGKDCYSIRVGGEGAPELTLFGERAALLGAALKIVNGLGYEVGPPVDKLGETELDDLPALGDEWVQTRDTEEDKLGETELDVDPEPEVIQFPLYDGSVADIVVERRTPDGTVFGTLKHRNLTFPVRIDETGGGQVLHNTRQGPLARATTDSLELARQRRRRDLGLPALGDEWDQKGPA